MGGYLRKEKFYRQGDKEWKRSKKEGGENIELKFLQGIGWSVRSTGSGSAASPPLLNEVGSGTPNSLK